MAIKEVDVVVVGAGAAGLMAALTLAKRGKQVAVLEAADRAGGRIYDKDGTAYPTALGAEFVHGNLPLTLDLLQQAGCTTIKVEGTMWQSKEGELKKESDVITDTRLLEKKLAALDADLPVARFVEEHLSGPEREELRFDILNYVKGYYAADPARASTLAFRDEFLNGEDVNYRVDGGYGRLINWLVQQAEAAGATIHYSTKLLRIEQQADLVVAVGHAVQIPAKKVMITVSLGVLQRNSITFTPALPPSKTTALQTLGFGHVLKLNYWFQDAFWADGEKRDLSFLFSDTAIPTWWTQYPANQPLLTGWLGGPESAAIQQHNATQALEEQGLHALSNILGKEKGWLHQQRHQTAMHLWSTDPLFCGAYSYAVVGGEAAIKEMLQPLDNRIYFAGEALHHGREIGTVEAALTTAKTAAEKMLANWE